MDQLIYDEESQAALKEWITERTKNDYPNSICIGLARDGELIACVSYECFKKGIFAHIALDKPLTRGFLKAIFDYPFKQAKTEILFALVNENNKKANKLVQRLGFNLIQQDKTVFYQMVKDECKWLEV